MRVFTAVAVAVAVTSGLGCRDKPAPPDADASPKVVVRCVRHGESGSACSSVLVASIAGRAARGANANPSARPRVRIDETVWFDDGGRLIRAETRVRDEGGAPDVQVTIDRPTREVLLRRAPHEARWSEPTDAPWAYAPIVGPTGEAIATPLAAWVIHRAAASAANVRMIEPHLQTSALVPRDQLIVAGEGDETVIVGDDGADVDATFVSLVRAHALGVAFARANEAPLAAGTFTFVPAAAPGSKATASP